MIKQLRPFDLFVVCERVTHPVQQHICKQLRLKVPCLDRCFGVFVLCVTDECLFDHLMHILP